MQVTRREFVNSTAAVVGSFLGAAPSLRAADTQSDADKAVQALYESLTLAQRMVMCFDWDEKGNYGGFPLRPHVTNNWAVYKERTLGKEGEWDNWRIEGPAFVWYFRGFPHVHLWIHVADDPTVSVTSHFG